MRLSTNEINIIKQCILAADPVAEIYLFGSRVNDHLKGGDIDLLLVSKKLTLMDIIKIKIKLYDQLGEQKIDIVQPHENNKAFVRLAMKEGIKL
jgi:predicted nucleotidyltransferase